jgi:hypothetical protein
MCPPMGLNALGCLLVMVEFYIVVVTWWLCCCVVVVASYECWITSVIGVVGWGCWYFLSSLKPHFVILLAHWNVLEGNLLVVHPWYGATGLSLIVVDWFRPYSSWAQSLNTWNVRLGPIRNTNWCFMYEDQNIKKDVKFK